MKKVGIITDSTSDLTKELHKQYNIEVLPLYIILDGKTYTDGVDITTEEMYEKVDECGQLPKSSNVPPAMFEKYFKEYLEKYDQIFYIGIGSGFSATYQNAKIAAESFEDGKIFVADSKNLSSGIGLLLLKACKFRDEGCDGGEILKRVEELVPYVRTQFAINTLKYLHMGGRCSGVSRIFGTMLKLKPIIKVVDGAMVVAKMPIGYNRALSALLEYAKADFPKMDLEHVFITHAVAKSDEVYLRSELNKYIDNSIITETCASGVVATHCGPRTIGILYIVKPE